MVVVCVAVVDALPVRGVSDLVREDEHEEYQVEEDEDEEAQVKEDQLPHLPYRDEEDRDADYGNQKEDRPQEDADAHRKEPEGETPGVVVLSCNKTANKNIIRILKLIWSLEGGGRRGVLSSSWYEFDSSCGSRDNHQHEGYTPPYEVIYAKSAPLPAWFLQTQNFNKI